VQGGERYTSLELDTSVGGEQRRSSQEELDFSPGLTGEYLATLWTDLEAVPSGPQASSAAMDATGQPAVPLAQTVIDGGEAMGDVGSAGFSLEQLLASTGMGTDSPPDQQRASDASISLYQNAPLDMPAMPAMLAPNNSYNYPANSGTDPSPMPQRPPPNLASAAEAAAARQENMSSIVAHFNSRMGVGGTSTPPALSGHETFAYQRGQQPALPSLVSHYTTLLAERRPRMSSDAVSGCHAHHHHLQRQGLHAGLTQDHHSHESGDTLGGGDAVATGESGQPPLWALKHLQLASVGLTQGLGAMEGADASGPAAGVNLVPMQPSPLRGSGSGSGMQHPQAQSLSPLAPGHIHPGVPMPPQHATAFLAPGTSSGISPAALNGNMSPLRVLAHARAAAAHPSEGAGQQQQQLQPQQVGQRSARASWPFMQPTAAAFAVGGAPYNSSPLAAGQQAQSDAERAAIAVAMHTRAASPQSRSHSGSRSGSLKPLRCRGKVDKGYCERCGARMRGFGTGYCTNKECREIAAMNKRNGSRNSSPMAMHVPIHATATS